MFKQAIFLVNRYKRLKHMFTMHINLFKPVLFMLNRFDLLKYQYRLQIN